MTTAVRHYLVVSAVTKEQFETAKRRIKRALWSREKTHRVEISTDYKIAEYRIHGNDYLKFRIINRGGLKGNENYALRVL